MPGGRMAEPLSKRERDRYMKQMDEVVRTLKRMDKNVAKMASVTQKLVNAMGGGQ